MDYLLPHDQLALCIAALCHDVDHTGEGSVRFCC